MRCATMERRTRETAVVVTICLDGGTAEISTGIGFFDHMLEALAIHAGFGLRVVCQGDLEVDAHHTVEDVGIVLGEALKEALGNKKELARFGSFTLPMDETLAFAAVDISGRPYLVFDARYPQQQVGAFDTCLTYEFLRAFSMHAGITLHSRVLYGSNAHHMIEAQLKALAHALRLACQPADRLLSTKGMLD